MAKKKTKTPKRVDVCAYCGDGKAWVAYFLCGVGVGILVTNPFVNPHPMRWALLFLISGVVAYTLLMRKN